jgi:hypothetical protein
MKKFCMKKETTHRQFTATAVRETLSMRKGSLIRMGMFFATTLLSTLSMAQGPYPKTGDQTVCLGATEPYGVVFHAGSTYDWTLTSLAGGNGTIIPGATSNLITVHWTIAGSAALKVVETNAQGCVGDPVSIVISVSPPPTVTVNSSAICAGTTANITATPGSPGTYTYTWTVPAGVPNPGNVASFTSGVAGTYSVVIANSSGCSSTASNGTVTINTAPDLVIHNPSICGSGTVDLTAATVTTGSTAGLSFTYWLDAAATIPYTTPAAATPGTYYIKGSLAAGCFAIKPVTVTVNAAPTLIVSNPPALCGSGSTDITAPAVTAGSDAGLTYTYWTDAAATIPYATPAAAAPGTYYVKGSLPGGCFAVKPVVVTANALPAPVISGPDPVCISSSGTTSTYSTQNITGHTYNWTVTGGTVSAGSNTNLVTVLWTTAGTGTVTVKEAISSSGCSADAVKNITVNPKPVTSAITHN